MPDVKKHDEYSWYELIAYIIIHRNNNIYNHGRS